jgi:hypothetical protein
MGSVFSKPAKREATHGVSTETVPVPRPERGGGQVLFCCGPWPGLLERLWFVAPVFFA